MCVHVLPASVDLYMPSPSDPCTESPRADIDDVGIGRRDLNRADAVDVRELIEDREPRDARARGFPDAAGRRADVEHAGLADRAGHGRDAPAVKRADVAPPETGNEVVARSQLGLDIDRLLYCLDPEH